MNATSTLLALVMVTTLFSVSSAESPPAPNGPETVATELLASLAAGDVDRAASLFHHPVPRTEEEHTAHHWWVSQMLRRLLDRVGPLGEYAPVTDTESELIAAIGAGDVAFRRAPPSGPTLLTYRAAFARTPDAHLHVYAVRAGAGWEIDELDFTLPSSRPGADGFIGWLVTDLMPID